jgi:hypothetical protein
MSLAADGEGGCAHAHRLLTISAASYGTLVCWRGRPSTVGATGRWTDSLLSPSKPGSALPCPAGRSVPGRGGPGRLKASAARRDRSSWSVLGPWRTGTTGATSGHQRSRGTAGRRAFSSGSSHYADGRTRLWSQAQGVGPRQQTGSNRPPLGINTTAEESWRIIGGSGLIHVLSPAASHQSLPICTPPMYRLVEARWI